MGKSSAFIAFHQYRWRIMFKVFVGPRRGAARCVQDPASRFHAMSPEDWPESRKHAA